MKSQYRFIFILLLMSGRSELHAQSNLFHPDFATGARATAMGQSTFLSFSDAIAVFQNPSSISQAQQTTASMFFTKLLSTTNYDLGLVIPTEHDGAFGISLFRISTEVPGLDRTIISEQTHFLFTYGIALSEKLAFGFNAKFVSGTFWGNPSQVSSPGIDFGLQHLPGASNKLLQNLRFGLTIDNLVRPAMEFGAQQEFLPRKIRAIVENDLSWGDHAITLVGNLLLPEDTSQNGDYSLHGGLEYDYRSLSIRTLYRTQFLPLLPLDNQRQLNWK